jgi:GTP-binding protein
MLQKEFVIAISKSDMLDDELKNTIRKEMPAPYPVSFFSSIQQQGLQELKDTLWTVLNNGK